MNLDHAGSRKRRLNDMLPRVKYHLRLGIPNANFDRNFHLANRANHYNTRCYFGTIGNILIRPILGCLLFGCLRVPNIELMVVREDGQLAPMAWNDHTANVKLADRRRSEALEVLDAALGGGSVQRRVR